MKIAHNSKNRIKSMKSIFYSWIIKNENIWVKENNKIASFCNVERWKVQEFALFCLKTSSHPHQRLNVGKINRSLKIEHWTQNIFRWHFKFNTGLPRMGTERWIQKTIKMEVRNIVKKLKPGILVQNISSYKYICVSKPSKYELIFV